MFEFITLPTSFLDIFSRAYGSATHALAEAALPQLPSIPPWVAPPPLDFIRFMQEREEKEKQEAVEKAAQQARVQQANKRENARVVAVAHRIEDQKSSREERLRKRNALRTPAVSIIASNPTELDEYKEPEQLKLDFSLFDYIIDELDFANLECVDV